MLTIALQYPCRIGDSISIDDCTKFGPKIGKADFGAGVYARLEKPVSIRRYRCGRLAYAIAWSNLGDFYR